MNDFFSIPHSRQLTTSANMTEEEFFDCDWNDDGNTAVTLSREEEEEDAVFRNIHLADAAIPKQTTDYSKLTRKDLEDVYIVTERPNISALLGYAASEEGQKLVSVSKHGDFEHPDEGTYENKTDRDVIRTYLTNIRKSGEVKISYRYDVVGNMLIKEGLIQGARVYPYSDSFSYPFSVTQLPQHIRNLALSENHFSNDDEAAFHRIVQGKIQNEDARRMSKEIIDDKSRVYDTILSQGEFKQYVGRPEIKEAIHAISNGQTIATTKFLLCPIAKEQNVGQWLEDWAKAQQQVTKELCSSSNAKKGIALIKKHFPTKTKLISYEMKGLKRVKLKKPKTKTVPRNEQATWRSFICQEAEALGLAQKVNYFTKEGFAIGGLIHDDVPVAYHATISMDEVEQELTHRIRTNVPDYGHAKVVSETIIAPSYIKGVLNDEEAAEIIYKLHPHWVTCLGILYVYDDETGLYSDADQPKRRIISQFTPHLYRFDQERKGDDFFLHVNLQKSYGSDVALMNKALKMLEKVNVNDEWMRQTEESSFGKLLFKNGIYYGHTGTFVPKFDPNIMFRDHIDRDFRKQTKEEKAYSERLRKKMFHGPLGKEAGEYQLKLLAIGLFGDNIHHGLFAIGLGFTKSGKSTIAGACLKSCGTYCGTFLGENLKYSKHNGQDEAAKNRWMLKYKDKRMLFSNEINTKVELNGNAIKKCAGRGDRLQGRDHHKSEVDFLPAFMCWIFAQDLPPLNPIDDAVINRVQVFNYPYSFVDRPSNMRERKKDPHFQDEMNTTAFQDAFLHLLIDTYTSLYDVNGNMQELVAPQVCEKAKKDWLPIEEEGIMPRFLEDYEITRSTDDFVTIASVKKWLADTKSGVSLQKLKAEIAKHCDVNSIDKILTDNIKKGNCKVWKKVKCLRREENSNDDEYESPYFGSQG